MGNRAVGHAANEMIQREEVDIIFLKLFEHLGQEALEGAASCTGAIFDLSANYIEKPAFDSLRNFYDLYFGKGDIEQKKDKINANVSEMVDYLQSKLDAGENIDEGAEYSESEEVTRQRLSLSGVQKQLEGLITLDSGIRDQILPALASMQFEDAIRQRLGHVVQAWWKIAENVHTNLTPAELSELAKEIAQMLSSVEETKSFYELVLNEKPPEGQDQRSVFIEF